MLIRWAKLESLLGLFWPLGLMFGTPPVTKTQTISDLYSSSFNSYFLVLHLSVCPLLQQITCFMITETKEIFEQPGNIKTV